MNGHMEKDIAISASEAAQPHINNLKIDTSPGSNDGDESPLEDENEKDVAANGELEAKPKSPSEDEATSPGGLKNYFVRSQPKRFCLNRTQIDIDIKDSEFSVSLRGWTGCYMASPSFVRLVLAPLSH
jgi:hypothetical protein